MGRALTKFVEEFFEGELHPVSLALSWRAAEMAARCRLRGADAVYVATAEAHDATLVTWDQEMLDRGAAVVETRTPEQWIEANGADPA